MGHGMAYNPIWMGLHVPICRQFEHGLGSWFGSSDDNEEQPHKMTMAITATP